MFCKIYNAASINKHVYLLQFNNYTTFTYIIYMTGYTNPASANFINKRKPEEQNCNVRSKSYLQCSLLQCHSPSHH